jgi:hypothetical protein
VESRPRLDNRRRITIAAMALTALAASGEARAESDAERTARAAALYDQAIKAMAAKQYAGACPKLEEVVKLEPEALGARFRLAECYEASGRLASAWGAFLKVEAAAAKAGKGTQRAEAHERAERLKPQLARVVIVVPDEIKRLPALEIQRDGVEVTSAAFGAPLPVDKGKHSLSSTAQGKKRVEMQFTIEEDGQTLTVNVPPPPDAEPAPPPARAQVRRQPSEAPPDMHASPHVYIESGDPSKPLALYRVPPGAPYVVPLVASSNLVCSAPCDQEVSGRPGQTYVLGGPGIPVSSQFQLGASGRVSIKASPGSAYRMGYGIMSGILGVVFVVAGAIVTPLAVKESDGGSTVAGGVMLGIGALVTIIGFSVAASGRSTYTVNGSKVALRL